MYSDQVQCQPPSISQYLGRRHNRHHQNKKDWHHYINLQCDVKGRSTDKFIRLLLWHAITYSSDS